MAKEISEKELRSRGYLTVGEFVNRLIPGLKEYLEANWGSKGAEALHHPEDLFANAGIYLEVGQHIVGDFGVNGLKISEAEDE